MLQKQRHIGSLTAVDRKLEEREQRSLKRRMQEKQHAASAVVTANVELPLPGSASANEESECDSDINMNYANK